VRQPLAGEVASRRELLEALPFVTGYGVEIAMLIDVWRKGGLEGIAQVDLDVHHNRHQPLSALSEMAETVLATIVRRLVSEGRLSGDGIGGSFPRRLSRRRGRPRDAGRAPRAGDGGEPVSVRCLYVDLDGTLLGRGASLVHDGEGTVRCRGCVRSRRACGRRLRSC